VGEGKRALWTRTEMGVLRCMVVRLCLVAVVLCGGEESRVVVCVCVWSSEFRMWQRVVE
jgi:hypothetical protein